MGERPTVEVDAGVLNGLIADVFALDSSVSRVDLIASIETACSQARRIGANSKPIKHGDIEHRRYELAKEFTMHVFIMNEPAENRGCSSMAERGVHMADALLKELDKPKEEG